jgi:rare lipoprotein A
MQCNAIEGLASWYGKENKTSSCGKPLHNKTYAAAHRTYPIGAKIRVTYLKKSIIVVIEDRGPYLKSRIIDLNYLAAKKLGIIKKGIVKVKIEKIK